MISVICVFNNKKALENNLLASLREQNVDFELILIDNTQSQFDSIPKALNNAASRARYNYVMFAHQDVYLIGRSWLNRAERIVEELDDIGVAGVAGVSKQGEPIGFIVDRGRLWGYPVRKPASVFTLDECLLMVPRSIFLETRLDEDFEYHSYGADFCLRIQKLGLKAYVLPCPIHHNSATLPILRAGSLTKDDLRLYVKHRHTYAVIPKTTGTLNSHILTRGMSPKLALRKIVKEFTKRLSYRYFKILYVTQQNILEDFTRVGFLLDLGTVPVEQLWIKQVKKSSYSIGVSTRRQYILVSKRLGVHDGYVLVSHSNLPFREYAFDAVLIYGILEYLKKAEGVKLLTQALQVARKRIMAIVPNKGYPISDAYKCYRSSWSAEELGRLGFRIFGMNFRIDLERKIKILKAMPFLKLVSTKICPSLMASNLFYIKKITG